MSKIAEIEDALTTHDTHWALAQMKLGHIVETEIVPCFDKDSTPESYTIKYRLAEGNSYLDYFNSLPCYEGWKSWGYDPEYCEFLEMGHRFYIVTST